MFAQFVCLLTKIMSKSGGPSNCPPAPLIATGHVVRFDTPREKLTSLMCVLRTYTNVCQQRVDFHLLYYLCNDLIIDIIIYSRIYSNFGIRNRNYATKTVQAK